MSERLRPKTMTSMIGNEQARLEIIKWLKHWKIGSKPLLLTGPPGVGKSTSIYAAAREFGYAVLEYNASDVRTKEKLREALSPTLENSSILGNEEKMLIFLDEIDGISGRSDYAGLDFVLDFIENATLPVAMAANLEGTQKLKKLEQKSLVLRFKPVSQDLIYMYLKAIRSREELEVPDETISKIAGGSRGDVRQALNSLQTLAGRDLIGSFTDHQFMSDSSALDAVLASSSTSEAIGLMRQYDVQPYDKIRSIFDSVVSAKNLSTESKAEALNLIADADIVLGKINREQSWRLLRYFDRYLSLAIASKKIQRSDSSIPWNLRISIWNDGRVLKEMNRNLADIFHVGRADFASVYLPYLAVFFKRNPEALDLFLQRNDLGDSEKRVILKLATKK